LRPTPKVYLDSNIVSAIAKDDTPTTEWIGFSHGTAPASTSSSSTRHTPIGAFKCAAALGTRANACVVARNLINALHNADGRGKEYFPPRGA
jgi:hypothetical protein